jgi:hypothetical protein
MKRRINEQVWCKYMERGMFVAGKLREKIPNASDKINISIVSFSIHPNSWRN